MIGSPQAWSAGTNRAGQWMRIDAGSTLPVYGVQVQTRCCSPNGQRVTAFTIQHSTDDSTWSAVDGGVTFTHAFTGASGTFDARFAAAPVMAQYVRITVVSWMHHISMRAGLIVASQVDTPWPLQVAQPLSHTSPLKSRPPTPLARVSHLRSLPQCEPCDHLTCSAGYYRGGTGCTAIVYGMRVELGGGTSNWEASISPATASLSSLPTLSLSAKRARVHWMWRGQVQAAEGLARVVRSRRDGLRRLYVHRLRR